MKKILSVILVLAICLALTSCGTSNSLNTQTVNLSKDFKSDLKQYIYYDNHFVIAQNAFSMRVFDEINKQNPDKNIVFSPISISSVLGMLAGGADGTTLSEIENLLADDTETLSNNIYTFFDSLPSTSKISNVNSMWIKNDEAFKVNNSFLQYNANFYNADVFKSPFDKTTVDAINSWVKSATKGNITEMLKEIDNESCMFLINALTFDAEWNTPYAKESISDGIFTTPNSTVLAEMMRSNENFYIKTSNAEGFIKYYKNGDYAFVALLPDKSLNINDYVSSLKNTSFDAIIKSGREEDVIATMPKFENKSDITLNDTLKKLGVNSAFDVSKSDFSKLGTYAGKKIYLSSVQQKAYISVNEKGTKAGAVTMANIAGKTSLPLETYHVTLDRPFVYAIVDTKTSVPLFVGKVLNPNE